MFHFEWRQERKLLMLTQGALRQRRRRALESAEERQDRLARDAERKRMKRMSESVEEAAWRRTVDALRKKEKRMKERETKAIMAQYGVPTECIPKVEISSECDPVLKVLRLFPRKRRPRLASGVDDYPFSFPEGVADITEFGGSPSSLLSDLSGGVAVSTLPCTSRAPSGSATCYPPHEQESQDRVPCLPNGLWCPNVVLPMTGVSSLCSGVTLDVAGSAKVHGASGTVVDKEDLLDSSQDESLSALSPEVIIREVKPEPLTKDGYDEERLSDERIHHVGQWFASSALSINSAPTAIGHGGGMGAAICDGRQPVHNVIGGVGNDV